VPLPPDNWDETAAVFDDTENQSSRDYRTKPRGDLPEYARSREEGDFYRMAFSLYSLEHRALKLRAVYGQGADSFYRAGLILDEASHYGW
jgi:hypothetical protein